MEISKLNLNSPDGDITADAARGLREDLHAIEAKAGIEAALAAAMGYVQGLAVWCEDAVGMSIEEAMALSNKN